MSKPNKEPSLKGTFAAVMGLGGFIIVSWVLVFLLFWARQ
ncbi:cytochrome c oxidase subunit 2A [Paenibacillus chartarius]|uniref:Cytochrome c oxidase subunit 2A n=1 Tax=Paenibacillus chartarius TaxID=747481 RepID=A0ABV6DHW9_9BACL